MTNTNQLEALTKENVRLYEENMKLRLMLGTSTKRTNKNNSTKTKSETSKTKKTKNNTNNVKSTNKKTTKTNETVKINKNNLSKFQQERESKKAIVLAKRNEKMPVPEIAKLIKQSEPTVRNYIRELRVEGKLAR